MPRIRRTIRKPTRWTPDEWARVEEAARARGVPPLRFVREAALGAPAAPLRTRRSTRDDFVKEIGRVLNNLRQLQTLAELDWAGEMVDRLEITARAAEAAIRAAPPPGMAPAARVRSIVDAGRALNELARRGNTHEELPPDAELITALVAVEAGLTGVVR